MKANLVITIAAAATLLTACSKDNEVETPWNGEIRLNSGVTVQQTRASGTSPDTQIANNQTVQVVVSKQSTDTHTYTGYDQALTAQGNGTFAAPATPMFYPESGMGVSIYAFHPSTAGNSFVANADQSTDPNYLSSDLLYSESAEYERRSAAHSLTFKHKLSKLTYTLTQGAGSPSLTGATVVWTNVCNTVSFDKTTGVVSNPTNPSTIKPHATYGTIIAPQTVSANTALLEVTLKDGGVLTYKPTAAQVFDGEKKYNYEITVSLTGLSVTSTIADWEAVTNRKGEATM